MEPDSVSLIVVVLVVAGVALFAMVKFRLIFVRILAGSVAVALSATAGMAGVNDYYGYYQTWSQLSADLNGSYSTFAPTATASRSMVATAAGRLESVALPGARSGINRTGLVYLPPQYFQKAYSHTTFPVVELMHGTPGDPSLWVINLRIVELMGQMIAHHQIGPMILVMPTMNAGHHFEEGVNAPGALDDTYLTQDVRADVLAKFRASPVSAEWGIAGFSSGGYCAANLALRHRGMFGAAGIIDGYFRPTDGEAAKALQFNPAAEAANDPLRAAGALHSDTSPMPAFWLAAGTGLAVDYRGALAFAAALQGVEQVPLFSEPSVGHNFYAWSAALPHLLSWMWSRLAAPQLSVKFPIAGPVTNATIIAPTLPAGSQTSSSRSSSPTSLRDRRRSTPMPAIHGL